MVSKQTIIELFILECQIPVIYNNLEPQNLCHCELMDALIRVCNIAYIYSPVILLLVDLL
jgi:hypothetical protein